MTTVFGLSAPSFIIEKGGKYYLTLSVLEYDGNAAGADATLRSGVAKIGDAFEAGQKLAAVEVAFSTVSSAAQTQPRSVNMISLAQTNPTGPDD